jgi:hypothetical protein
VLLQFLSRTRLHDALVVRPVFVGKLPGEEIVVRFAKNVCGSNAEIPGVVLVDGYIAGVRILHEDPLRDVLDESVRYMASLSRKASSARL